MKKQIPRPIMDRILALVICTACFGLHGVVWSIAVSDRIMLLLSLSVLFAGAVKALSLYRIAVANDYDLFEGVVLSSAMVPLRKRQVLVVQSDIMERLIVQGRHRFAVGKAYRIYLGKQEQAIGDMGIPESMIPARVILGYECMEM